MTKKSKWGGRRPGAGRPTVTEYKTPPQYIMVRIAQPTTPAELAAIEWYKSLSPADRLADITESHTFQAGYAERETAI